MKVDTTTAKAYNLCSLEATGTWVKQVLDLRAYAGQIITLQFGVSTDANGYSSLFIDDVAFQSSATIEMDATPASPLSVIPQKR